MRCSYVSCDDPATASVLAGATRVFVCFTHEREYADRYGSADIYALPNIDRLGDNVGSGTASTVRLADSHNPTQTLHT